MSQMYERMKNLPPVAAALKQVASKLTLDAKRKPTASGIDTWYPYYAGYSRSFARQVLENIPLQRGATIADPWNGSGTTTYVADQLGYQALGFDINPVATLVASAKLARPLDAKNVVGLARRIAAASTTSTVRLKSSDPLAGWLPASTVKQYRTIEAAVLADLATASDQRASALTGDLPPLASFLLLALLRASRRIAGVRATTNPTWFLQDKQLQSKNALLGSNWVLTVEEMANDLIGGCAHGSKSQTRMADAAALPLHNESIDVMLTSPPYCTRIDYVVNTSFELAALGVGRQSPEFLQLRRANMGTPLARKGLPVEPKETWPREICDLLSSIRAHPSKASSSYYYKTYWQYFDDCERALKEIHRTLKLGGAAVLVVQSSYYKELQVDLPKLYISMGESIGFVGNIVHQSVVRRALSQINSRSRAHRTSTTYHEATIALEKM